MTLDCYEDDEDNDEDNAIGYMKLVDDGNCIGCKTRNKVCPKGCFSFS